MKHYKQRTAAASGKRAEKSQQFKGKTHIHEIEKERSQGCGTDNLVSESQEIFILQRGSRQLDQAKQRNPVNFQRLKMNEHN